MIYFIIFLQISHPSFFLSSFSILCSLSVNQASFFLFTSVLRPRPWLRESPLSSASWQVVRRRWDLPHRLSPRTIWLWLGWVWFVLGFVFDFDGWIFCHLHLRPRPTVKWAPTNQKDLISSSSLSSLCPPSSQSPPVHYTIPARPMPSPNASKKFSERHFILTLFEHQKF